jgi:dihydrolipoamide dehydrogenase
MPASSIEVDVAVIGGGTAGLAARKAAVRAGARVLLINAGPWGTTCVRAGCMPSKLLLVAAKAAVATRRAGIFGIETGPPRVNGRAVMARVHAERDYFLRSILEELNAIPPVEKIDGLARFIGPTTLKVADKVTVVAKSVVIATGASPSIPKPLASLKDKVLTSDTVFNIEDLPTSLAVVGAGPLGIELAAAFTRLGVRTTVFDERDSLGGLRDPEVSKAARTLLGAELDLKLRVKIKADHIRRGPRFGGPVQMTSGRQCLTVC